MKIVLKPYWVAEECFLQEAILWVGFNRIPLSEIMPDKVDYRFDSDVQDEYQPRIPDDHGYIESHEAVRVGLPPNPEWEEIINDDFDYNAPYVPRDIETIKSFLELDLPEEEKEKLRTAIPEAEKRAAEQADWDEKYAEYIELVEAKIYVALREGQLEASGRKIPKPEVDYTKSWVEYEHEPIQKEFWRADKIDWMQSASENPKGHYCHICVKMEQLMAIFPPPAPEQTKAVHMVADQFILNENQVEVAVPKRKRGRPAKDWDSFHLEVMARVKSEHLPEKQEAFISDMQSWCLKNWGEDIGRSTILEKVSPVYKKFKNL
ncbi:MAG: hypothetical protein J0L77_06130 [Alphaproteobacteria bacterium]|nr:hypothetical protein [Alphaproteobacteria bacterium]